MNPPATVVYLLCGPSLAGKSTVASALRAVFAAEVICADTINGQRGLPFGGEDLPESVWAETLHIQLQRLRSHAERGRNVVVDDTLCYRWLRDRFRQECSTSGAASVLLLLRPPEDELFARHEHLAQSRKRPILSLARLQEHLARFEWPIEEEQAVDITSPASLQAVLDSAVDTGENAA
jgi:predicted kinase